MQSHEIALRDALSDDGDLELRFQCGQSLPVHSQKLKLASSVLKGLITAVLDDLIATSAAKRRRTVEGSSSVEELPGVKVSLASNFTGIPPCAINCPCDNAHAPINKAHAPMDFPRLMVPLRTGWRC